MALPSQTTYRAALPYGITSLAIGVLGATLAVAATTIAIKIIGISAAIIGSYGFLATIVCGLIHAGNPQQFRVNYSKYALTLIGSFIADIISRIATETISHLLDKALGRTRSSVRISII